MRRLLVALVVCGLLVAVSASLPAGAQQAASITLTPSSAPAGTTGTWSIAVTGFGFVPNTTVTITFANTTAGTTLANRSGQISTTINPNRRVGGYYSVQACDQQGICGFATFESVPQVSISPPCSRPGQTTDVTVTGSGWPARYPIYVTYDYPSNFVRTTIGGADSTFSVVFTGVNPPNRDVVIYVEQPDRELAVRTIWSACPPETTTTTTSTTVPDTTTTSTTRPPGGGVVTTTTSTTIPTIVTIPPPTPGAALLVTPSLGPGGFVTTALGSGFPANQPVTLGWSPGIGIYSVTAGPDGTFVSPVLIMNRDVLGPRALVATSGEVSASASFLVVPSTVQPSGKDVAQITRARRFLQR